MTSTIPATKSNIVSRSSGNPTVAFLFAAVVLCQTSTAQEICPAPENVERFRIANVEALVNVPLFNSYPQGNGTVYLDMDGQQVTSTSWGLDTLMAAPDITLEAAIGLYEIVKEDMSFFSINVTTDSNVYNAAHPERRIRMIITPTSGWYPFNVGGLAFVGSFTWGEDNIAFVFSDRLGNYPKYMGECASHEAGHALGLSHQSRWVNGVRTEMYHSGTGTPGTHTSWAPIMGVSYYANNTTWTEGYNSSNVFQRDKQIIGGPANGLTERPATDSTVKPNAVTIKRITLNGASLVNVRAKSGGNSDLKIKLNGVENNIVDSLDCSIVGMTLPAGTHDLEITAVINPNNPTGYSNHGHVSVSTTVTPLSTVSLDTSIRYQRSRSNAAVLRYNNQTIYFKATISEQYAIVSMVGQVLDIGRYRPGMNEINIGHLPSGVYVLRTEFNNYKIIK